MNRPITQSGGGALDGVLSRLQGVKQRGMGYTAQCPAHQDKTPSLSITEKGGKVLLNCHAGCGNRQIVDALGLKMTDLFDKPNTSAKEKSHPQIAATYDYTDERGKLLYQVVRYSPKGFSARRPDEKGGWIYDLKGVRRVPYQLPNVLAKMKDGKVIFIVEGEKDVLSLMEIGLPATCNSGGAGKWTREHSQAMKGACVVILPDNDDAGWKHAQEVAESFRGIARGIKVVELPCLPPKEDVSYWLSCGFTASELLQFVRQQPDWIPPTPKLPDVVQTEIPTPKSETPNPQAESFPLTDLGNAERLAAAHGANIRFIANLKAWMVWNGAHWLVDSDLEIERLANSTVRSIYREAEASTDSQIRRETGKWAVASESSRNIKAMIQLARPMVAITSDKLDVDQDLLCCLNGVLDLRTGELLPPLRENYITQQIPIRYDPQAECPTWEKFLSEVIPSAEVRHYLRKAVGYSLTGDVSEQCLFFLYGEGKNGKSTFMEVVSLLEGGYFAKIPSESVMLRHNSDTKRDAVALVGKRMISTSELTQGQRLHEGFIKDVTGGDTLSAKPLYGEQLNFQCGSKLWMYGNHKPAIKGKDEGIWRRIRMIPFTVQIPESQVDRRLAEKLRQELPGILRWAVEGCVAWRAEGLKEPNALKDEVNEYRREQDSLADFLGERTVFDKSTRVAKKDLWNAYREWIDQAGEEGYETQRQFNQEIKARPGIKSGIGHGNVAVWRGIAFREQANSGDHLTSTG